MSVLKVESQTTVDEEEFPATVSSFDATENENVTAIETAEHPPHTPETSDGLRAAIQSVEDAIAPVWPLKNFVAVNPFLGLSDRSFLGARRLLRSVSDCEVLMPLEYFQAKFRRGDFAVEDIKQAVEDVVAAFPSAQTSSDDILNALNGELSAGASTKFDNLERQISSVAELSDKVSRTNWLEVVREEIGRHLAAYYDDGQAVWQSPWKGLPLFEAWKSSAKHDRRMNVLGVRSFCSLVESLPETAEETIAFALDKMNVPKSSWSSFLLCQAHSIPGWSAWTKHKKEQAVASGPEDFMDLLAIRLTYDFALFQHLGGEVTRMLDSTSWDSPVADENSETDKDVLMRFVLLRATERAYERRLIESLDNQVVDSLQDAGTAQPLAQMVFCIDVRSERYRRSLETTSTDVQTFGFAGFFGVPIAYQSMGEQSASPQLPALLSPAFTIHETVRGVDDAERSAALNGRSFRRSFRKMWKQFQTSAVGCFGFVESTGLGFGWKLLSKSVFPKTRTSQFDGVAEQDHGKLGPDINELKQLGFSVAQQADMAEGILRGIGIIDNFARLVVFCGHGSSVANNPLQAGLDCGACCGHSGEPNARIAAMLLNQSDVRSELGNRGIQIPSETQFVAAIHDTTSDDISYFDTDLLSAQQAQHLSVLRANTTQATGLCQLERLPYLAADNVADVLKRTTDWSEVRPEWGLAGNAAFIVAPRSVTQKANLDGRSFLHSYNFHNDSGFKVLEQIMTAPMVVAHWINMQYYASSVDNQHYGSGSKTIHNVVGKFGIFSGNGGDLTTGLPWQSVHNGAEFQHEPLRLLSVIAAPRTAVADIIHRNHVVEDLLVNSWLNLVVLDDNEWYRFTTDGSWQKLSEETY